MTCIFFRMWGGKITQKPLKLGRRGNFRIFSFKVVSKEWKSQKNWLTTTSYVWWGDVLQGSISPNFFAKQKVAGEQRLAKNSKFNFINKVVRLKLGQILPNYVRHLPKKVSNLVCSRNSGANVDEIDPRCQFP